MIIECPYCHTRFRLAAARLGASNPMLKCSACRHIFPAPATQRSAAEPGGDGSGAPAPPEEELRLGEGEASGLAFDEREWESLQPELPLSHPDDGFSLGSVQMDDDDIPPTISAGTTPPLFPHGPEHRGDSTGGDDADDEPSGPDPARLGRRASFGSFFVLLAVLVVLYLGLAATMVDNRELSERIVSKLPIVGHSVSADRLLFRKVALADVSGSFVQLKGGAEIFVVTGRAFNTASRPLHDIEIEVRLLDRDGHEVGREVRACGGMISRRILSELTPRELDTLRRVRPQHSVSPGESAPFAVVFRSPPEGIVEYVSRVAAARRHI